MNLAPTRGVESHANATISYTTANALLRLNRPGIFAGCPKPCHTTAEQAEGAAHQVSGHPWHSWASAVPAAASAAAPAASAAASTCPATQHDGSRHATGAPTPAGPLHHNGAPSATRGAAASCKPVECDWVQDVLLNCQRCPRGARSVAFTSATCH